MIILIFSVLYIPLWKTTQSKMKDRIWPVSWSQSLMCPLFQQPFFFYLHIDVHSEITTKYSTLIYMKNYHVKKCTFFPSIHASCMGTFVQLISLTKISQLDEYHQKKSRMYPPLQISTKCAYQISFNFMCSKALKVTRLHKCHCVITVLGKACVPQRLRNEITTVCY